MMGSAYIGQYLPVDSVIHRIDAKIKLVCMCAIIAAVIMAKTAAAYAALAAIILAVIFASGIGLKSVVLQLRRIWLFMLIILFMNTLFYGGETEFFRFGKLVATTEGITQGVNIAANITLIMALSSAVMCTISPLALKRAITSLLSPLKAVGLPSEDIALIIGASIQFIPIFADEADKIKKAQTARGARFNSKSAVERAKSYPPLIIPVFVQSLRRAEELAMAIEARGYVRSRDRRTLEKQIKKVITEEK